MRRSPRRRRIGVLVALVVVAAVAGGAWFVARGFDQEQSASTQARITGPMPTAEPGSEVTAAAGTSQPSEPAPEDVATDPPPVLAGGDVDVVLTYSGWADDPAGVEVSGFVSGVVESTGTCRLTLTHAGSSVTVEQPGEPDASTTICPTLRVPAEQLTPGPWQAVLSYTSASSSGTSTPATVQVPAR